MCWQRYASSFMETETVKGNKLNQASPKTSNPPDKGVRADGTRTRLARVCAPVLVWWRSERPDRRWMRAEAGEAVIRSSWTLLRPTDPNLQPEPGPDELLTSSRPVQTSVKAIMFQTRASQISDISDAESRVDLKLVAMETIPPAPESLASLAAESFRSAQLKLVVFVLM